MQPTGKQKLEHVSIYYTCNDKAVSEDLSYLIFKPDLMLIQHSALLLKKLVTGPTNLSKARLSSTNYTKNILKLIGPLPYMNLFTPWSEKWLCALPTQCMLWALQDTTAMLLVRVRSTLHPECQRLVSLAQDIQLQALHLLLVYRLHDDLLIQIMKLFNQTEDLEKERIEPDIQALLEKAFVSGRNKVNQG